MKRSIKNIAANFISKTWGFLALYFFSRVYVDILGIQQYGIISFYTLVLGVVGFVDVGLSASINREFAKEGVDNYLYGILRFFERIYILTCAFAGLIICIFAPYISERWLGTNNGSISVDELTNYVRLIGLGAATQLVTSIYFGALMGRQLQVWANAVQLIFSIAKTAGSVVVLFLFHKSLYSFFMWQFLCNLLHIIVLRSHTFSSLNIKNKPNPVTIAEIPKELWKYMGGMTLVAILSALAIQSDKLIASKSFSLSDFGFYSLASMLAQLPVLIITPIALAMFPLFVRDFVSGKLENMYKLYQNLSFVVCLMIFPLSAVLCLYGKQIFEFWISIKSVKSAPGHIGVVIFLLTLGNTFQALRFIPFYLLLAKGKTKFITWLCLFEIVFIIPTLVLFIGKFGLAGIGIPWLIVKSIGYIFVLMFVDKEKKNLQRTNYKKVILVPAFITLVISACVFGIFNILLHFKSFIIPGLCIAALSTVLNVFFYDKTLFSLSKVKATFSI